MTAARQLSLPETIGRARCRDCGSPAECHPDCPGCVVPEPCRSKPWVHRDGHVTIGCEALTFCSDECRAADQALRLKERLS
jgi:hypothetical protein